MLKHEIQFPDRRLGHRLLPHGRHLRPTAIALNIGLILKARLLTE